MPTPRPRCCSASTGGRPDTDVPLRDVQLAARQADPSTTTIYGVAEALDRHAAYVVIAFVASG